ncbi:hypothetical protein DAPPUDRAFT_116575 [Daphnia pulex]|uniref:Helitron helicase-like domain-containing protein n=1 Tax=Daphnia pulex TaxID=6669 RepID=E9HPS7_DAPPU|nr:hypothetical protein DAPPUDRAFT_116575 [Daphnia pulex]|eukprot:EFX66259.1 hypothetical protein DAPPUDRAFT_116575 [Daphnia pulex]
MTISSFIAAILTTLFTTEQETEDSHQDPDLLQSVEFKNGTGGPSLSRSNEEFLDGVFESATNTTRAAEPEEINDHEKIARVLHTILNEGTSPNEVTSKDDLGTNKSWSTYVVRPEKEFISDSNPDYLELHYPDLFPFECGGFGEQRKNPISRKDQSGALQISKEKCMDEFRWKILELFKHSQEAANRNRQKEYAAHNSLGKAEIWFTVIPDDTQSFNIVVNTLRSRAANYKNPVPVGEYRFKLQLLPYRSEGVFGVPKDYLYLVEEQSRLTLHAHFLVWLYGHENIERQLFHASRLDEEERKANDVSHNARELFQRTVGANDEDHLTHIAKVLKLLAKNIESFSTGELRLPEMEMALKTKYPVYNCLGELELASSAAQDILRSRPKNINVEPHDLQCPICQVTYTVTSRIDAALQSGYRRLLVNMHDLKHRSSCFKNGGLFCRYNTSRRYTMTDCNPTVMADLGCNNCTRYVENQKISLDYGAYASKYSSENGKALADLMRSLNAYEERRLLKEQQVADGIEKEADLHVVSDNNPARSDASIGFGRLMSRSREATNGETVGEPVAAFCALGNDLFEMSHETAILPLTQASAFVQGEQLTASINKYGTVFATIDDYCFQDVEETDMKDRFRLQHRFQQHHPRFETHGQWKRTHLHWPQYPAQRLPDVLDLRDDSEVSADDRTSKQERYAEDVLIMFFPFRKLIDHPFCQGDPITAVPKDDNNDDIVNLIDVDGKDLNTASAQDATANNATDPFVRLLTTFTENPVRLKLESGYVCVTQEQARLAINVLPKPNHLAAGKLLLPFPADRLLPHWWKILAQMG